MARAPNKAPELGMIPSEETAHGKKKRLFGKKAGDPMLTGAKADETRQHMALVTFEKKPSMQAESFRASLTSILFSGQGGMGRNGATRPKVMVVTSPSPGEGKTTVCTNLAIAMAETGQRVLLLDADTRKPRLHEIFEKGNDAGLTTVLQGRNAQGEPVQMGGANTNGNWKTVVIFYST